NQCVPVEDAPSGVALEIALLARRERVVDENHLGVALGRDVAHFVRLAAAHEKTRIGPLASSGDRGHGPYAGGEGKLGEFLEVLRIDLLPEPQAHKDCALAATGAL